MKKLLIIGIIFEVIVILLGSYYIYSLKKENLILRQQDFTLATAFNQLSNRISNMENVIIKAVQPANK